MRKTANVKKETRSPHALPKAKRRQLVQPRNETPAPTPVAVKNLHKAPLKQWRKWSTNAKRTFNSVKSWMLSNQKLMTHPKQKPMVEKNWQTLAHNAAWIAADHVDHQMWGPDGVSKDVPDMDVIELFDS